MKICIVNEATTPQTNENRKMEGSDHVGFQDEKMVKINENTTQPETQEKKKCVLSALMISAIDQVSEKPSGGGPINRLRKSMIPCCSCSHSMCHLIEN